MKKILAVIISILIILGSILFKGEISKEVTIETTHFEN